MDTAIEKAKQKIEYLSSDDESMRTYYERERLLHERANMINSAEERKAVEQIVIATGLTEEEINKIR